MYRSTKKERNYHRYLGEEKRCYFCKPDPKAIVENFKSFYIMRNNFPYDFWDGQKVKNHLMVVAKKHFPAMDSKDKVLLLEYAILANDYSNKGFDIFVRVPNSPSRSQVHFHTHLIKASGKKFKSLKYTFKPYTLEVK